MKTQVFKSDSLIGRQMAERLGNQAINQMVAGSISGRAK